MGFAKLNPVTAEMARIDPDTHPGFVKLWNTSGMERINLENLERLRAADGLALLCIVDDPNMYKETFDMVVIGPEIRKMFGDTLSAAGFTDPKFGRRIASGLGIHRLPAVAIFRFGELLGVIEGLKPWGEYESELVRILTRREAPKKSIAISAG